MPGTHNDINVLQCSPVFAKLVEGHSPPVTFEVNGRHYNKGYYLADGIYQRWSTFVKTIKRCARRQEVPLCQGAGGLQEGYGADIWCAPISIYRCPVPYSDLVEDQMWEIMTCCVILHNMIIESEQEEPASV